MRNLLNRTKQKLKSMAGAETILDPEELKKILQDSSVPISQADCRACTTPCDEGHEEYPKKFDVDTTSQMFGSVKPYNRQVVISTGKIDWEKEVTEAKGTLAAYLLEAVNLGRSAAKESASTEAQPQGLFLSSKESRIAILNGSHRTLCQDNDEETVLLFPDYIYITGVPQSLDGAQELWKHAVDPAVARSNLEPNPKLMTFILPYSCVIMLCSHKTRDNRCSIASEKLETTFIRNLEHKGWETHTHLDGFSHEENSALQKFEGTQDEKEAHITGQLQAVQGEKKVLIIRNSHIGGHKFAGNCIIHFPEGSSVWYGRVTPHEVESIVEETIIGGKILPTLLRGGLNVFKPGCDSLHNW